MQRIFYLLIAIIHVIGLIYANQDDAGTGLVGDGEKALSYYPVPLAELARRANVPLDRFRRMVRARRRKKKRDAGDDEAEFVLRVNPYIARRPMVLRDFTKPNCIDLKEWCIVVPPPQPPLCPPADTPTPAPTTCGPSKPAGFGHTCIYHVTYAIPSARDLCDQCSVESKAEMTLPTNYHDCSSKPPPTDFLRVKYCSSTLMTCLKVPCTHRMLSQAPTDAPPTQPPCDATPPPLQEKERRQAVWEEVSPEVEAVANSGESPTVQQGMVQPPEAGVQPSAIEVQPSALGVQPSASEIQPSATGVQPHAAGVQPPAAEVLPPAFGPLSPAQVPLGLQPSPAIGKIFVVERISGIIEKQNTPAPAFGTFPPALENVVSNAPIQEEVRVLVRHGPIENSGNKEPTAIEPLKQVPVEGLNPIQQDKTDQSDQKVPSAAIMDPGNSANDILVGKPIQSVTSGPAVAAVPSQPVDQKPLILGDHSSGMNLGAQEQAQAVVNPLPQAVSGAPHAPVQAQVPSTEAARPLVKRFAGYPNSGRAFPMGRNPRAGLGPKFYLLLKHQPRLRNRRKRDTAARRKTIIASPGVSQGK